MAKQEKLAPWESAVAGAAGAVLANAIVYPLDIVKTRIQVQIKKKNVEHVHTAENHHYHGTIDAIRKIVAHDGVVGLYSGINGALIGVASTNFAYFYWYSVVRTVYTKYRGTTHLSTPAELSLGAAAGAIAQIFTIPVSVVTTRQQTQPRGQKKGLIATGRDVVNGEDGWAGLWRGLKASLVLCVNPAITYGAYQRLKDIVFPGRERLAPWEAFLLGAMSKSMATLATQPLIVAKVGLQSNPPPQRNGVPFKSFPEVMAYIIEHEGPFALFKGIGPQLLKGLLVQGLLMMTKERVELLFLVLFAYLRTVRAKNMKKTTEQLQQQGQDVAATVASQAKPMLESVMQRAKASLPVTSK